MDVLDRPPTLEVLVRALKPLLRSGLPATPDNSADELLALRGVLARAVDPDDRLHRIKALDGLLRTQLVHFQDDTQSEAARVLFGLTPGTRGSTLTQRRSRAAAEMGCNEEHFRKRVEPKIVKQLAWQLHQDTQTYVPRARDVPPPLLSVVDLADDVVFGVADDAGVRGPRPLVADGALVVSVTGCSAW